MQDLLEASGSWQRPVHPGGPEDWQGKAASPFAVRPPDPAPGVARAPGGVAVVRGPPLASALSPPLVRKACFLVSQAPPSRAGIR